MTLWPNFYLPKTKCRFEPPNVRYLESDYVHALLGRASLEFRHVRLFVRQVGAIKVDDRMFRAGQAGQADLWAVDMSARHYEIEVKRYTKLSPAQIVWRDWCRSWNVPWTVIEVHKTEQPGQTVERWIHELQKFFAA